MAKLFITLYLMVIASFAVNALYVVAIGHFGESIGDGAKINEKISKGTFIQLNKSLDDLNKQQTDKLLLQYKEVFGDEFRLAETATLNLDKDQIKTLEGGKVLTVEETNILLINGSTTEEDLEDEEEVDILYFKRPNTSLLWRARLDYDLDISINNLGLSTKVVGKSFLDGTMFVIYSRLLVEEKENWSDTLNTLQANFGFPLQLKNLSDVSKNLVDKEKQLALLEKNKAINISQGTKYATFIQKIPNSSSLLQIGPVEVPWYLRNSPYLFIAAFILSFATTLLLWLWPFWTNLTKIKTASEEFGSGNYSARIPHKRWSPIANVSKAFNAMAEQTQSSMRAQKELTSAISHELRTPVARMRFAIEMLDASSDKSEKSRYVKDINEDIDELNLLLEELLTYARFDQEDNRVSPSLEKVIPWISSSMEKLMPLAGTKILHYKVEGIGVNETSVFEPRLMTRVLDNIVQNALRYAKQTIEVTLSKDKDDYLLIIDDDGDGIPKDKRDQIFNAFSRIDASRDRASGGFGLGLAIANKIIKAHQGNISIHSSPLGGARFEVRFPARQSTT